MQIEVSNLTLSMRPKLEELLYRLICDATELGIGLEGVTLALCELDGSESKRAKTDAQKSLEN